MIRFLLILFATIVFFLLAAQWLIHDRQAQWAYGASAAFVASFLVDDSIAYVRARRTPQ